MPTWTKVKKNAESFLADSLQGRVAYHITRYGPGHSHIMARGWITFDKREILSAATPNWFMHYARVASEIREINQTTDFRDPAQQDGYYAVYDQAAEISTRAGLFSRDHFADVMQTYPTLSIDTALASADPLTRALAMFDRRLGKRRLRALTLPVTEHTIVRRFYQIRCEAEGLDFPTGAADSGQK